MWQTLESDPGLFTLLVEKWGVKDLEFNEVWSIDQDSFRALHYKKLYGALLLFNYSKTPNRSNLAVTSAPVWFSQQIAENSCATNALLSLVFNAHGLKLTEELDNIKEFTTPLDSESRGEVIGNAQFFKATHNSMARPLSFSYEGPSTGQSDAFHFIAFIKGDNNHIYELDGLQRGPIDHGLISTDFETALSQSLQNKIAEIGDDLRFSVMLATNDLRKSANPDQLAVQKSKRQKWKRDAQIRSSQLTGLAMEMLKQMAKIDVQGDQS